jgi:uncharacterized Tic20 family protein
MEPNRDERNVAVMAQSLGLVVALPVWLMWRTRSPFVRAHAIQSTAFDGITLAALVIVCTLSIGGAVAGNAALSGDDIARLCVVALCGLCLAPAGCLAVLIAALVWRIRAAMAANQGRLYRYPLLARLT